MEKNVSNIVKTSKSLFDKKLVSGKAGNISARFDNESIAITPTLKSLGNLVEEDVILVDIDGNNMTSGTPSSEYKMHLEIYKKREDINAVIHTHSPYATGFAFSSKKIKRHEGFGAVKTPFLKELEYEKPGSDELAIKASEAIGNEDVLILKHHGVICLGENLKEAELLAEFVEQTAKTQYITYMLNSVEDII